MPTLRAPHRREAFRRGNRVEVLPDEPGLRGAHFKAVVVGPSTEPGCYTVEYDAFIEPGGSDRPLREAVPARSLRPRPPPRPRKAPAEHAAVDARLDDGWWLGVALGGADGAAKVRVCFPDIREVSEVDAADVRPHLEWAGEAGAWHFPDRMMVDMLDVSLHFLVCRMLLLRVVAKTIWKNNLLVEYNVSKSDGTALPEEIVDMKHVRPCPPQASAISFRINDKVEAFQGVEIQLSQKLLRLCYDWVDGQWKQESQMAYSRSRLRPTPMTPPPRAASIKKRKTRVDGLPDPVPSLTKKCKSPRLGPSEENKHHKSSSEEIYPDLPEKRPVRDAPCPDDKVKPAPQPEPTPAPAPEPEPTPAPAPEPEPTPAPAPEPEPTPAPAQRRKAILKLSLPMIQPAAPPDTTVSPPTRESNAQKNEAVQKTVPEVGTCSKSPAKSLLTPLDTIIEELKGCREQWLQAQSQLDRSATKAKEIEGQVAKLRAAREDDAQHLREVMIKQASLEQRLELKDKEIEDLKKKLVDLDEQMSCVDAELPRGAVMAASHALGVLKNHLPDLDLGILSKGYACTTTEAQALADQARPIVEPFVERLGLSVSSAS
ncbi:hypothetical protein BAE44_0014045 [Dichanthelium oligosanthes]|uniref:Agenet domain-containing protein n=1 Tax=Dichanthelium oligosanthes TaxID=888268 RepID=A0A1E5VIK0_9POAL|nr:hypothetical protein BAE44_0014045 [Dichanthelium oligosanthes]